MAINIPIISKFDDKGVKGAEGAFKGIGKSLAGLAGIAAGAFAAIGIGSFVKESITAASDLDESFNAINKSYGAFAADVTALGDGVASRLGLSQVDFNAAAVRFSAFAEKIAGEGGSVAGVVDSLTTRAADFASVFNIEVSEALQVFQSGLSGEAEPLKRFGINLLDSEVKAYAYANGIAEVGAQLTENEKVQARYGLLLESTAKTAGDFADTSDGLANSQRILSATMEDLRAKVGAGLAPAVATVTAALVPLAEAIFPKIAEVIDTTVGPAVQRMADYFSELVLIGTTLGGDNVLAKVFNDIKDAVAGFLEEGGLSSAIESLSDFRYQVFSAIIEAIPAIVEGLAEMLPTVIEFIAGTMIPTMLSQMSLLIEQLLTVFGEVMPTIIQAFTDMIPSLVQTIADLAPLLITTILGMLPTILQSAIELFTALVEAVVEITPQLIDTIVELLPELVDSIVSMLPGILDAAIELFTAIVDSLPIILPVLLTAILDLLPKIIDSLISMLPALIDGAFQLFTGLIMGLQNMIPQLLVAVLGLVPQMVGTLLGAIPQLVRAGFEIVSGFARGIIENAPRILGNAIASIGNTLVNGVKSFLGIASPSKVFAGLGGDVVDGLKLGLDEGDKLIKGASFDMAQNLKVSAEGAFTANRPAPSTSVSAMASVPASNVINLTVNAGMGADGSRIGQQIVDEILKYERSSGKVFARA
jgi:phage-related protein